VDGLGERLDALARLLHTHIQPLHNFQHLVVFQVQEQLDEVSVDEVARFARFSLIVERPPPLLILIKEDESERKD
jgi:hypothetical protein